MSEELLTIDDIAALYKLDRKQVRDSVVKTPGFPAFAPGTTWRKPRWQPPQVQGGLPGEQEAAGDVDPAGEA